MSGLMRWREDAEDARCDERSSAVRLRWLLNETLDQLDKQEDSRNLLAEQAGAMLERAEEAERLLGNRESQIERAFAAINEVCDRLNDHPSNSRYLHVEAVRDLLRLLS